LDVYKLPPLVNWSTDVGLESLKSVKLEEFEKIDSDLCKMRDSGLIDRKRSSWFEQSTHSNPHYHYIYVYIHQEHASFSKMLFRSIAQLCDVEECCSFIKPCIQHSKHVTLLPYFHGNNFLQEMCRELTQNNPNSEECKLLHGLMSREFFSRPMPVFSCEYNEDQWTARLHECLIYNKIDCEYTAHLRGKQTEESWYHRLPPGVSKQSLVF